MKSREQGPKILCVKHTLLAVAGVAVQRVNLGGKQIDGLKWALVWESKNTPKKSMPSFFP